MSVEETAPLWFIDISDDKVRSFSRYCDSRCVLKVSAQHAMQTPFGFVA